MQNHKFVSNKYCLPSIISNVKLVFEDQEPRRPIDVFVI